MKRCHSIVLGALLALGWVAAPAAAQGGSRKYGELLKRIPEQANVLLLADVDGLFQSPLGKREQWRERAASRASAGLGLADDVSKLVVAARFDLDTMSETWRIGMAESREALPDLEKIAVREGGFVEKIRGMPVAWTPRGFYLFTFPTKVFGFVEQADRHALWKWIDTTLSKPRTFPPSFADTAFFHADGGSAIVLALNLTESVSPSLTEPWLKTIPSVKKANLDPGLLATRLARVKSAYLEIDVGQEMTAKLVIDFNADLATGAPILRDSTPVLKELIITLLENCGAMLPEIKTWNQRFDQKTQSFELSGRIGEESARRVLSLAHPPNLSSSMKPSPGEASLAQSTGKTAAAESAKQPPVEPTRDQSIKSSQAYYRSVVDLMHGLRQQDRPNYKSMKLWYDRYAKQIEELPILGIDTELLDWGGLCSRTLREMGSGIHYSAKDQTYRLAQSPNGFYAGYGGYYGNSKGYDQAVLTREANAVLSVQLDANWQKLEISIADMRRKMTEKYKVDF